MIKKHPILTIFLILLFIFISYILLLVRDFVRITNYMKDTESSRSSRVTTIGLDGLCNSKKIEFDEQKAKIDQSIKELIQIRPEFLDYKHYDITYNKSALKIIDDANNNELNESAINVLTDNTKSLDENLKIDSISDYDWNIFNQADEKQPLKATYIYDANELCNLSILYSLTEGYLKGKNNQFESDILFASMLKMNLLNLYVNKGQINQNKYNLEGLHIFFDKLKKDEYSKKEMENMLKALKLSIPLIPDFNDHLLIHFEYGNNMANFFSSNFYTLYFTVRAIFGNPYPLLDKIKDCIINKKYKEIADTYKNNMNLGLIVLNPIFMHIDEAYGYYIDKNSQLALFQAYLEEKLGKEITAIDPYDNNPIRYTKDNEGKKVFYCLGHEGKDLNGEKGNIVNCDSDLKEVLIKREKQSSK